MSTFDVMATSQVAIASLKEGLIEHAYIRAELWAIDERLRAPYHATSTPASPLIPPATIHAVIKMHIGTNIITYRHQLY